MKNLLLLCTCALGFVLPAWTQKTPAKSVKNPDTFRLGSKSVRIPPPEGFTNIVGRVKNDDGRFASVRPKGRRLLQIDIADEVASQVLTDPRMDLDFFTTVALQPQAENEDYTARKFAEFVEGLQSEFPDPIDPNGKIIQDAKKIAGANLTRESVEKSGLDTKIGQNLGFFDKTENIFSALTLHAREVNGRPVVILETLSALRVNSRLIDIYIFKVRPADKDFDTLPEFAKKWTAAIIAANK